MEATASKKTALYEVHKALGAKLIPFAGYDMPVRYSGDKAEHFCVRERAGVFDVSHMGEFIVRGPQALALIQQVTSNDAAKLVDGKAQYSCLPNHEGGIVDDLIVYRMAEDNYMLVVNAANIQKDWDWITETNKQFGAELVDISEQSSLLAVSGPKATEVLKKLTDMPIGDFAYYGFQKGTFAGLENILVATTGYTGERTYEIFFPNAHAHKIWDALFEAGAPLGLEPTGLGARDTLRLEMGYMLYGNDITDTTSPLEAGLGWITKLKKGDFNGRDAILKLKEEGLKRKLVGFVMDERAIPRSHCEIAYNGETIGEVTSGSLSPLLNKGIGMGYVPKELAAEGGKIDIVIRKKHMSATIVRPPFVQK
ncbi:MAG TPA: glycine cleavage system aminomethyltransferase GcvT [Bacteroidetes bacterium]|nr:glycine cleavage system aminomethyltransferase GcvT [Bacteroidota bacterium]